MSNDVLALLEMMLTFGQMMLCPADTNEKIQATWLGFFGSPCWVSEVKTIEYCFRRTVGTKQGVEGVSLRTTRNDYATAVGLRQRQFAKQTVGGSTPAGGIKRKDLRYQMVQHKSLMAPPAGLEPATS